VKLEDAMALAAAQAGEIVACAVGAELEQMMREEVQLPCAVNTVREG
jgi:hypothetical protein